MGIFDSHLFIISQPNIVKVLNKLNIKKIRLIIILLLLNSCATTIRHGDTLIVDSKESSNGNAKYKYILRVSESKSEFIIYFTNEEFNVYNTLIIK